jgi:hypothetical protein
MFSLAVGQVSCGRRDRLVWRLLDTRPDQRYLVLMRAFQTGELRLSEAPDVLLLVERIESLGCPPSASSANASFASRIGDVPGPCR